MAKTGNTTAKRGACGQLIITPIEKKRDVTTRRGTYGQLIIEAK